MFLFRTDMAVILFRRFILFRKRFDLRRPEFDRLGLKQGHLSSHAIQRNAIGLCDISSRVHLYQNHVFDFACCIDLYGETENAIN